MVRRALDAVLAVVIRLAVRLATRKVEVHGLDRIPDDRPVLIVANHFNGLVDPLVVVAVLGRVPRFLAKATLWKVWPVRPLLRLAGLIPVHRRVDRVDGGAGEANVKAFAAAERALGRNQLVAIFPEGTTHDEPRLAPVRTGAARIALGARAEGVTGMTIVPVGLLFEDKVALRTRVLVRVGHPIDVDGAVKLMVDPGEAEDESNPEAVRALSSVIADRLREVSPDYSDRWEHAELSMAAEVALRPEPTRRRQPIALGERERVAQAMAKNPAVDSVRAVRAATQRYGTHLHLLAVDDEDLLAQGGVIGWARRLVYVGILLVIGNAVLVPALLPSVAPALIVGVLGTLPAAPVTKGTVRVLSGLLLFLTAWIAFAVYVVDPGWLRLGWVAYQAVALMLALPIVEATIAWWQSTRSWWHLRDRRGFVPDLLADRGAVVDAVAAATRARIPAATGAHPDR